MSAEQATSQYEIFIINLREMIIYSAVLETPRHIV